MGEGSRPYDMIIYGASGFTGQYVAAEVFRQCKEKKIALAGRTKAKLEKVFDLIERETGEKANAGIVIADNSNDESIVEMCRQAHCVLNCVGPYRFYGEQVVKACVETGTHYLDISGEPGFLQKMQLQFHEEAQRKGIHIVGAAGFDSIPADFGLEHLRANFNGVMTSAESFWAYKGDRVKANYGTYLTIVHSLRTVSELKAQQKAIFREKMDYIGPRVPRRNPGWCKDVNSHIFPFLGADISVMKRTQYFESKVHGATPIQLGAYVKMGGWLQIIGMMLFGLIMGVLSKFSWGVSFLENHPKLCSFGVFSKEGLTREELAARGFVYEWYGKGYSTKPAPGEKAVPDKQMKLTLTGPEIGYIFCSIAMVAAANTILEEKLVNQGGVLTPGSALKGTTYASRLGKRGVKITIEEL